jgi:hypothetical protein
MNSLFKVDLAAATLLASTVTAALAAAGNTIHLAVTDTDGIKALQAEIGP